MNEPIPWRGLSMRDGVAARLRTTVLERTRAPGESVDAKTLAAAWQISRMPWREALRLRAAEGLVERVSRRGSRGVVELDDDDAEALVSATALPEGRRAHETVLKAAPADIAEPRRLHEAPKRHAASVASDAECAARAMQAPPCAQLRAVRALRRRQAHASDEATPRRRSHAR